MRLPGGCATPQSKLDFTFADNKRLQAAEDQLGAVSNEIVETELAIQRQR